MATSMIYLHHQEALYSDGLTRRVLACLTSDMGCCNRCCIVVYFYLLAFVFAYSIIMLCNVTNAICHNVTSHRLLFIRVYRTRLSHLFSFLSPSCRVAQAPFKSYLSNISSLLNETFTLLWMHSSLPTSVLGLLVPP